MIKVGILALQGSVEEHIFSMSQIEGVEPVKVKAIEDLAGIAGIVLPGGESTTIGKLLMDFNLLKPLKEKIENGMPVWGTCAGMILLAKEIVEQQQVHMGVMDIKVRRNAYGGQLDSFVTNCVIKEVSDKEIPLVFIRAPWIEKVGKDVDVLAEVNNRIVAARSGNMVVTSFHPELTRNLEFHKYFIKIIQNK